MTIGTAESPFLNRVTITLTGRRRDIPLVLTRGLILGSKAIGVFGNVCTLTITQNTHFGCFVFTNYNDAMVHEPSKACKYIGNSVWKTTLLMYVGWIICYASYMHSAYLRKV